VSRGRLVVVGTGPGPGYMTPRARQLMLECEAFVGGADALADAPAWGIRLPVTGDLSGLCEEIGRLRAEGTDVCVLTSGDPGYFSLLGSLEREFPGEAQVEPGISSTQLLCARLGLPWTEVAHHSVHGRSFDLSPAPDRPFAVLCDPGRPPQAVARRLLEQGFAGRAGVGVSLGREDERITLSDLAEVAQGDFGSPAVLLVCPDAWLAGAAVHPSVRAPAGASSSPITCAPGLPDSAFERLEGVPLSRWEVRAVLAAIARPVERRLIWDVGAGSGGFAVEFALASPAARVVAFERDPVGCRTTAGNARRLGARVEIVEGRAPAALRERPDAERPDLAVVGGSGGGLEGIVEVLGRRLLPGGRLIVTAVTLATLASATQLLRERPWVGFDALQLSSARLAEAGIMKGSNPVTLLWADREM
jgi:precorrin-6B C5,15-methyltransferase / cobalt-precorrin-6B C5,C15-methyltransferase